MMLGIRVTTGRKYKVQPNSSPSPRAALSRSASARPKSIKKFSLRTKSSRSYRSNIDSSKENFDDDDEDDDGLGNTYKVDQEAEKNGETLIALEEHDYTAALELIFEPSGGTCGGRNIFPTPPHKLAFPFKFKDYMANAFRAVRYLSGIDEAEYMMSLAGDFNYIEFIANSKSGNQSHFV